MLHFCAHDKPNDLPLLHWRGSDRGQARPAASLVYDGAGVAARMERDSSVARSARAAAEALLDTSL